MLAFPAAIRIYVALEPVDMRKQYDGLWAAAQQQLGEAPKQGALFCFTNRERTRLKLLYWDGYATPANMGQCGPPRCDRRRARLMKSARWCRILKRFEKSQDV